MFRKCLLVLCSLLMPAAAPRAADVVAAVTLRTAETGLRFEDGNLRDLRFRRAGVEYRERIATGLFMGFAIGYSESESRDPARPFETVGGKYGALDLRFDLPLSAMWSLYGGAEYLLQRDERATADGDFETRAWETRAEFGPRLRYRRLELAAGAGWRDIDYRETLSAAAGDTVRRAEVDDAWSGFAVLGLSTDNDGRIALRYEAGGETAWSLRFEREF